MSINAKMKLLIGGKEAFPAILEEIRQAERSIYINMFVWRDDVIGRTLAKAILEEAERGVKVVIVKDRYGILCEYSEEDQSSFFHKDPTLKERLEIFFMKASYQTDLLFKPRSGGDESLLLRMREHPNISIHDDRYRRDHSKFFVFDGKTVILGGVNVEDKENGADRHGNDYLDYMVRIESPGAVRELRASLRGEKGSGKGLFGLNPPGKRERFGIRRRYMELIDGAHKELFIIMAYVLPSEDIMERLKKALDRGVKLRILLPARANYLNASNRAFASQLLKYASKNGGDLEIYLSDMMTHIKAMVSDNMITIGSANLVGKSYYSLGELNVFVPNDGGVFARSVKESFREVFEKAGRVTSLRQLRYLKWKTLSERIFMGG